MLSGRINFWEETLSILSIPISCQSCIRECYETRATSPPLDNVLVARNGALVPREVTVTLITWQGLPAVEAVLRDISERKRAENTLQQYERAVEGLEEMIVVVDREYRYVMANGAFLHYRCMEKEQVLGRFVSDLLDKEIFDTVVRKRLDECFQGKIVKYELRHDYPKLGPRDLFLSYYPVQVSGGVAGAAWQDVTERKRMEDADEAWQKRLENSDKKPVYALDYGIGM